MMDALIAFFNDFSPLSDDILAMMSGTFTQTTLKKGGYFARAGDYAKHFAFLESGIVRAFYVNYEGKEYNQYLFVAPTIIGAYSSLISGQEIKIPQQALTDCTLWKAPFEAIERLSENNYEVERLRRMISDYFFLKFEKREIEMALLEARDRYLIFQDEFPDVEQQIPQYHVASYLGITPTQLSRIKRKLYEDGQSSLHR